MFGSYCPTGSQQCVVIISCDAGRDIPDINFEDGSSSGDSGGGDDDEDGIPQFLSLFKVSGQQNEDTLGSFIQGKVSRGLCNPRLM